MKIFLIAMVLMGISSESGFALDSGADRTQDRKQIKQINQLKQNNQAKPVNKIKQNSRTPVNDNVFPSSGKKTIGSSLPLNAQNSQTTTLNSGSKGSLLQLFSGMIVVIISVIVMLWLMKRFSRFSYGGQQTVKILGGISLGTREKIVLIEVGTEQLLVGVAPGRVNLLHQLQEPVKVEKSLESFQSVLGKRFKDIFKRDQHK